MKTALPEAGKSAAGRAEAAKPLSEAQAPEFRIRSATVIAFFPLSQGEMQTAEDVELLAEFQRSAGGAKALLRKKGINLEVVYADAFQVRTPACTERFEAKLGAVGYYMAAMGQPARVVYGVMCEADLVTAALRSFAVIQ